MYLDAHTHRDGKTTLLKNQDGNVFMAHTWWSRLFGKDEYHTDRIKKIAQEAGVKWECCEIMYIESLMNKYWFPKKMFIRRIMKKIGVVEYV